MLANNLCICGFKILVILNVFIGVRLKYEIASLGSQ